MKAGIRKTVDGLRSYMKKHGYTGLLYPGECGCGIDELAPCGEDHSQCIFGYKRECTAEETAQGYDFMVSSKKPEDYK